MFVAAADHTQPGLSVERRVTAAINRHFVRAATSGPPSYLGRALEHARDGTAGARSYIPHEPPVHAGDDHGCFRGLTPEEIEACRLRYTWRAIPVDRDAPDGSPDRRTYFPRIYATHAQCADAAGCSVKTFRLRLTSARRKVAINMKLRSADV